MDVTTTGRLVIPMNISPLRPDPEAYRAAETDRIAAVLDGYRVLVIEGTDAAVFLQAQLSSDIASLAAGTAQFSAFHSAKGRVFANFVLFRSGREGVPPRFYAILPSDLAGPLRQRLALFVLRAKVTLSVPENLALVGIGGPGAATPATGDHASLSASSLAVRWPDGRVTVIVDRGAVDAAIEECEKRGARRAPESIFDWLGVRAGIALIDAALSGELLPQALNWDVGGGVNFRKGCYPGQEIIARTHYLGRAKERLFLFHSAAASPVPATRLFSSAFGTQPCGVVVNAAFDAEGGALVLAAAQVDAAEQDVRLGAPDGPRLTRRPLPYAVPEARAQRDRIA